MESKISNFDTAQLAAQFREASGEIKRAAEDEIAPAANLIKEAFEDVGRTIKSSLESAAASGEFSLKKLGKAILQTLRKFAIENLVKNPIQDFLEHAFTAPFGGAKAAGGIVAPGQSFLVGESGPELFVPNASGRIRPLGAQSGAVAVTINLPGVSDAQSFRRSEAQISAALARAVGRGQRNL